MKARILLLIVLMTTCHFVYAQTDTLQIAREIESLSSVDQHRQFWNDIYESDQGHRGAEAIDSLDKLNLFKICYYYNKYGYPDSKVLGKSAEIISTVWIHNKYPEVDLHTFPIILKGFTEGHISKSEFRNYYLRHLYLRSFSKSSFEKITIVEILKLLKLKPASEINMVILLDLFEKEERFLSMDHKLIGKWKGDIILDTLYYNGQPIINQRASESIMIFQDMHGAFYFHKLYRDGSHYPEKLVQMNSNKFQFKNDDRNYLEFSENGDLIWSDLHSVKTFSRINYIDPYWKERKLLLSVVVVHALALKSFYENSHTLV